MSNVINIKLPPLTSYQQEIINSTAKYTVVEASVQIGKGIALLTDLLLFAKDNKDTISWWIAPSQSQAKIAYTRLKKWLGKVPHIFKFNDTDRYVQFPNGAVIWFKTGENPQTLYGESVHRMVIDEFTRIREESWYALRSRVTQTNGLIRLIGNINGINNWGYRLARLAESEQLTDPLTYKYFKLTGMDAVNAGIFKQSEMDDAKKNLPEFVFNELYLGIPSDDGSNPFGLSNIDACICNMSNNDSVVYGIDLGKSIDYTCIIGLDEFGVVSHYECFKDNWSVIKNRILQVVGDKITYVDSTGVGDPVVEELSDYKDNIIGYKYTNQSKQQIIESLGLAIRDGAIQYPDGEIPSELKSFIYKKSRTGKIIYEAMQGCHDDKVNALALAWYAFNNNNNTIGIDWY